MQNAYCLLPGFAEGVHYCRPKHPKAQSASGGIFVFVKKYMKNSVTFLPQSNSDIVGMMTKK